MTATAQQQKFNQYPHSKPFRPDIWHRYSKDQKRQEAVPLIYCYLVDGGEIKRAPPKKSRGAGRPRIFGRDSKSVTYGRDVQKFLRGDDFTQSGPRFTSRAVKEDSASQRDAERKAGISHESFTGAVISIDGKLRPRTSLHVVDSAPIDLVSDAALAASAKRDGGRRSKKVVKLIEDAADNISDAVARATIRDDLRIDIDAEHADRFKLAA